ncbi:hypothetical protein [Streptomyces sp. NRRL F-5123]|uniref:hypothetical protein n=1 Tax=Streptomyces sp. NRRL F-5123 TaxID=1463856 RepID=UPI0004E0EBF8|nr:hypothetical protein [Streptomyces sp. NRRL F-5123]
MAGTGRGRGNLSGGWIAVLVAVTLVVFAVAIYATRDDKPPAGCHYDGPIHRCTPPANTDPEASDSDGS